MHRLLTIAAVALPALVSEDVLEPSVQNEVDHAISVGEAALVAGTNAVFSVVVTTNAPVADVFGTNGLSSTDIALRLVSSQGPDGRWIVGTNDFTRAALDILSSL